MRSKHIFFAAPVLFHLVGASVLPEMSNSPPIAACSTQKHDAFAAAITPAPNVADMSREAIAELLRRQQEDSSDL